MKPLARLRSGGAWLGLEPYSRGHLAVCLPGVQVEAGPAQSSTPRQSSLPPPRPAPSVLTGSSSGPPRCPAGTAAGSLGTRSAAQGTRPSPAGPAAGTVGPQGERAWVPVGQATSHPSGSLTSLSPDPLSPAGPFNPRGRVQDSASPDIPSERTG